MRSIRYGILFFTILWCSELTLPERAAAQFQFERQETDVGNFGLAITNVGVIGRADVRNNPDGGPSMRFPLNSGTEHLFEAGLWVGGFVNNGLRLSTAAVTNPSGFSRGQSGYEFSPDAPIRFEGPETGLGISDQDIIANFTDRFQIVPGTQIQIDGHTQPLYADVEQTSLNWAFPFTENFSIIKVDITNNSQIHSGNPEGFVWDSVYVGQYADIVVRNVFTTLDGGSAFFNKGGLGYIDDRFTTYAFDAGSNDTPSINTYGGITLLGSEVTDRQTGETIFFHPMNPIIEQFGLGVPNVGPSYWLFSAGTGVFRGPERGATGDQERYRRMAEVFPLDETQPGADRSIREQLRTDGQNSEGNYISMISIGPFRDVQPGETITVYFGFIAAQKPGEFQGIAGKAVDNETTREPFVESIDAMFRVFLGEDVDSTGVLTPEKDINENGELDRFLFPTPPDAPTLRVELEAGKAVLFWDRKAEFSIDPVTNEQDFEGYRVYRSDLGDDLNPNPRMIRQWDTPGTDVGFNTGFDEILMDEPVTFPGDTTQYWYRFEVDGLLSGWQYQFSVTSFDFGSEVFDVGPLETSPNVNAVRVFPGTPVNPNFQSSNEEYSVGVYPNPYRVNAAWDGGTEFTRKIMFFNLPERAQVRVYTLAGDVVAETIHESTGVGDIEWFNQFSSDNRILPGGELAWDLLSDANQILTTGLYLYTVRDLSSGHVQRGKFAIIK
ncbi:MAG: hypothetical protein ACNA78_04875 [Balneolaceae bacterium]